MTERIALVFRGRIEETAAASRRRIPVSFPSADERNVRAVVGGQGMG